jgi:hypothetical protein
MMCSVELMPGRGGEWRKSLRDGVPRSADARGGSSIGWGLAACLLPCRGGNVCEMVCSGQLMRGVVQATKKAELEKRRNIKMQRGYRSGEV